MRFASLSTYQSVTYAGPCSPLSSRLWLPQEYYIRPLLLGLPSATTHQHFQHICPSTRDLVTIDLQSTQFSLSHTKLREQNTVATIVGNAITKAGPKKKTKAELRVELRAEQSNCPCGNTDSYVLSSCIILEACVNLEAWC
jgi:hypothetical protein